MIILLRYTLDSQKGVFFYFRVMVKSDKVWNDNQFYDTDTDDINRFSSLKASKRKHQGL